MKLRTFLSAIALMSMSSLSMAATLVQFKTTKGDIDIELFDDKAPISAKNFANYAKTGFYNGTIFHRVIPGFVVQGGGFTKDMVQKPTEAPIRNESNNGLKNLSGTLSMARTNDPNSATSQFFINTENNENLDAVPGKPGYAVFGKVVKGLDVVYGIEKVKTTTKNYHRDVPVEPVVIISTTVSTTKK